MMRTPTGGVLPPREGYLRWAETYAGETAVSALEDRLARLLSPAAAGRRLLDAGCGTGRRLAAGDARLRAGVDITPEMLARAGGRLPVAAADVRALPFRDASFDLVWCRLVLGHLPELGAAYRELGRVCCDGGVVLVTDFHPAAARAGHRRTFRDAAGRPWEVEHHIHELPAHADAAARAGLVAVRAREGCVGPGIRAFYARARRLDAYERQRGLPLVLGLLFVRSPS